MGPWDLCLMGGGYMNTFTKVLSLSQVSQFHSVNANIKKKLQFSCVLNTKAISL